MHKKLEADLTSLAHSILKLKNKEDVLVLKEKAYEVYEKLAVLAYVEEYINTTPNATETKEELVKKVKKAAKKKEEIVTLIEEVEKKEIIVEEKLVENEKEEVKEDLVEIEEEKKEEEIIEDVVTPEIELAPEILEQPFDELEQTLFSENDYTNEKEPLEVKKVVTLDEELQDTISVDVAAELFEKPVAKKSLNDQLQQNLQIGLNDRIAFVKNLFEGSQEDFNRVVSQLNTFKTEKEAKKFVNKMVKPDYDWSNQEEYEERFMLLVERKFL